VRQTIIFWIQFSRIAEDFFYFLNFKQDFLGCMFFISTIQAIQNHLQLENDVTMGMGRLMGDKYEEKIFYV